MPMMGIVLLICGGCAKFKNFDLGLIWQQTGDEFLFCSSYLITFHSLLCDLLKKVK
jgi:hypothetical protein